MAGSGGCNNSTTIHVQAVQTVEMEYITACELININEYLLIPNPENFVYYKIGYPEIQIELEGGIFDPAVNPTGIYTGVYTNSDGCLSSFQIFITAGEDVNSGTTATVTYCDFPDLFCPMESLQNLQPDLLNNPITLGGNWIVFDENGIYLEFYSHWDVCLTANELAQYGDNLVFKYAIGIAPCSPSFTDLNFFIGASEYFYSASVCPDAGPSNLIDFFPVYVPSGGAWTDSNGAVVVEFILPSLYPPGSVQTFYYSIGTGSCVITYTLELHIGLSSGEDITVHLCGDGSIEFLRLPALRKWSMTLCSSRKPVRITKVLVRGVVRKLHRFLYPPPKEFLRISAPEKAEMQFHF